MGREFELKYAANGDVFEKIMAVFGDFSTISMETAYFDTLEGTLSRKHITLRQRLENGRPVCTIKTPGDGFGRGEWDVESQWSEEVCQVLFAMAGLDPISAQNLQQVCGAAFTRRAKTLYLPQCTLEIALDEGRLLGGGREIPLREVELELKSGSEKALLEWAEEFARQYQLTPEARSKFRRAMDLSKGENHG